MPDTSMRYYVQLRDGSTVRHCWVDRKVVIGDHITLLDSDEPERWWTVTHTGEQRSAMALGLLQRGWHVGGL